MTYTTIDLSLIFNEIGYIDENNEYNCDKCITNITLIQSIDSPIKIGHNFLRDYKNLISVDTSQLINVIAIGNDFLYECVNLTIFDTTGLTSLITIGDNFLNCCKKLTVFDATRLTNLIAIGNRFLALCLNLTVFDTTGLTSLIAIGEKFLIKCNKNLTITVKNSPDCLHEQLLKTDYKIIQLYDRPIIHLVNNCVI